MLQAALERRGLRVAAVVGPLEPVAVAGQRLRGQLLLAPRGVGEAGGDFCGISRFREYRIFGARDGQGRTRHKQCAESRRTSRPNLASFSRVSTRGDRVQRNLGRSLSSTYHIPLDLDSLNVISWSTANRPRRKARKTCQKDVLHLARAIFQPLRNLLDAAKKGRRATGAFPGDTFLGGAALGAHFSRVFRGYEKGRPVGRPVRCGCGRD